MIPQRPTTVSLPHKETVARLVDELATRSEEVAVMQRGESSMKRMLSFALYAVIALSPVARADPPPPYYAVWEATEPGFAYGFAAALVRTAGSNFALQDFTVAAQLTAQNGPGVDQWAFGVAAEAWALPGSHSILVGLESSVINEEPSNLYPKIANNAVMKNRAIGPTIPAIR
jgi:hypothetical protein